MKIVICGSINFTNEILETKKRLNELGFDVIIPYYSEKILNREATLEEFSRVKEREGDIRFREEANEDLIKRYFRLINESDVILVLNFDKGNIKNYIGGNTFLEMGFAHILDKKIYLLNNIPEMAYSDEIKSMKPIVLNGDLTKIISYKL